MKIINPKMNQKDGLKNFINNDKHPFKRKS